MSDDNNRGIPGAGPMGSPRDILDVESGHDDADSMYGRQDTVDIEQELERALAEDDGADVSDEEINFDFSKKANRDGGRSSGALARFGAPLVVLALAAGAAGYVVTHPELLSGGVSAPAVSSVADAARPADSKIVLAEADASHASPDAAPAAAGAEGAPPVSTVPPVPESVPPAALPDVSAAAPAAGAPDVSPAAAVPPSPDVASASPDVASSAPSHEAPVPSADAGGAVKLAQADVPAAVPVPAPASPASAASVPAASAPAAPVESAAAVSPVPAPAAPDAPHPDAGVLQPATGAPAAGAPVPPPVAADPALTAPGVKAAPADAKKEKDSYYDSEATLPTGQMANSVGPRKVNPTIEPGQKLVVVSGIRKSTDSESLLVSADRALKLGRSDAALDMYNTLYKKNSHDPRILMGRAVAQQNLGMNDQAIASYGELLDIVPGNADAMVNMLGLLKQKDPLGALQRMEALQAKFPNHAGLAAQIGLAEGEAGNYQAAMRELGRAASIEPGNPQHPYNMAVLADRQADTTTAIKYYEQALQADSAGGEDGQSIPREAIYDRLATLRRH